MHRLQIIAAGLLLCAFCEGAFGAGYHYRFPLKISSTNPRILVDQNNVPFLMVAGIPLMLCLRTFRRLRRRLLSGRPGGTWNQQFVG